MSDGVFTVMEKRGLTTLEIFQNIKEGEFLLRGAKEWDDDLQFSKYATDFTYLDVLTKDYKAVGTETLTADFKELGLADYLERLEQLLRQARHEGIEFYYHRKKNIRVAFCKHSVIVGL